MNCYEHEGKELLRRIGLRTPDGQVISRGDDPRTVIETFVRAHSGTNRFVVKAQVLSGKRGGMGGVLVTDSTDEAASTVATWFDKGLSDLYVSSVLVEAFMPAVRELYLSCAYDTDARGPVLMTGARGGNEVESSAVERFPLDPRETELPATVITALGNISPRLPDFTRTLVAGFYASGARQIEINPLAEYADRSLVALDAKVALDDAVHHEKRPASGRAPTERETAASDIDTGVDAHRGTAGNYLELDGDIAILASGGGASLIVMDALGRFGLKAANLTEYSGNPPREKVHALTRIVVSKPGLHALLIVGGVANFTDIKETFAGIADALDELKPSFPIVVRRAGPNEREGMQVMRACAERNGQRMDLYGKETTMDEAVAALAKTL